MMKKLIVLLTFVLNGGGYSIILPREVYIEEESDTFIRPNYLSFKKEAITSGELIEGHTPDFAVDGDWSHPKCGWWGHGSLSIALGGSWPIEMLPSHSLHAYLCLTYCITKNDAGTYSSTSVTSWPIRCFWLLQSPQVCSSFAGSMSIVFLGNLAGKGFLRSPLLFALRLDYPM